MDDGLERRVLLQTGLSGAMMGAVVSGAVAGGLAAALGGTKEQVAQAAVGGALAGGIFGWHRGRSKGAEVIATARDRDQLSQLVKGARNYNAHLESYNASLRREVATANAAQDKKRLQSLGKAAASKLTEVNRKEATRRTSINNLPPGYREGYSSTLAPLQQEKLELEDAIRKIAATEKVISL